MTYNEYIPDAELAPYVKCIWALQVEGMPGNPHRERILPDGCMELIFHYGDLFQQYHNDRPELQPRSFVHGQMKAYIEIAPTGNTGMIAARFYPHGLAAFIDMPVYELTDRVTDVGSLFGKNAWELEQQLGNAPNEAERVRLLTGFLTKRLRRSSVKTDMAANAVRTIMTTGGNIAVNKLAMDACMSERQFERVFLASVGVSAKAFSKIVRFQHSIRAAQSGKQTTLTQLAHDSGYYDQAHYIRDFKAFAGVTPVQYFSGIHALSDLFTKG